MDFITELSERTEYINNEIYKYLPNQEGRQKTIFEAINYSVKIGGKRLRPMLMLETCRMFNGEENEVYPFMAALEMIHTYSLVHDDLPAMDNDDYRRGNLTTHKKFGHAMGVLCGDGLLNLAYETMAKAILESGNIQVAAKAFEVISKKAGVYGMVGGQVVDIEMTSHKEDIDTLNFINELKTGALVEAAMMCGAILANASDEQVENIERAASKIGLAFQIQDDILDVTSTSKELGKPVLSDEKNNKATYVTILGIEKCKEKVKELSDEAAQILGEYNTNEFLHELVMFLINRKQ
ncbi:MAG: polyprenyl synthetase family protein [Clostridiales bacterium]|nr:polyprenyl synthetase family protein [Clostridiales bacterium]